MIELKQNIYCKNKKILKTKNPPVKPSYKT